MNYVIAYVATAIVFFVIDIVWITKVARNLYFKSLGHLMSKEMMFAPIALFYLMYIAGIVFFAIRPALQDGNAVTALTMGALFGFFCYATYEFTNFATLRDWPVKVVVIDIIWGTFLTGSCALAGFYATRLFAS